MSPDLVLLLSIAGYKVAALATGVFLAYLGYRLFMAGVWGNSGDMEASYKDNKLVLKSAAPGTFFAVLGAAVIVATIVKGLELQTSRNRDHYAATSTPDPGTPSPTATLTIGQQGGQIGLIREEETSNFGAIIGESRSTTGTSAEVNLGTKGGGGGLGSLSITKGLGGSKGAGAESSTRTIGCCGPDDEGLQDDKPTAFPRIETTSGTAATEG